MGPQLSSSVNQSNNPTLTLSPTLSLYMEINNQIQIFFLTNLPSLLVFLCCAEEISRAEFPDGFLFGTATSAYQASMFSFYFYFCSSFLSFYFSFSVIYMYIFINMVCCVDWRSIFGRWEDSEQLGCFQPHSR